jgi:hypothetical protein
MLVDEVASPGGMGSRNQDPVRSHRLTPCRRCPFVGRQASATRSKDHRSLGTGGLDVHHLVQQQAHLLAALTLGSSVWPTSAQARHVGTHLGGPGARQSFDHSSYLHDRSYAGRVARRLVSWDGWRSGDGRHYQRGVASEEVAPSYAVPVYPAAHTADLYRLSFCSQRYRSFDPATGTDLV